MLGFVLLSVMLSILWCMLHNEFTPQNLVVGFFLGLILSLALKGTIRWELKSKDVFNIKKIYNLVNYLLHLIMEIIVANFNVTKIILNPKAKITPGIVAVPTEAQGDLHVTTFANSITLTPGTISMIVSKDQSTIYVHILDVENVKQAKAEMKDTLEKYISRLAE